MKIYNEITLAQELIRLPTLKTEDEGMMKFLSKKLSKIGFKCKIIKSKGFTSKPALNLFAKLGNSKPHINFLGHTDVVSNLNNWKIPPFKGLVKKGYLHGRGAQDMKGGIACWICAVSKFIKNKKFKGSISIIIAADEETTGLGTPTVIKYLKNRKEKTITCNEDKNEAIYNKYMCSVKMITNFLLNNAVFSQTYHGNRRPL